MLFWLTHRHWSQWKPSHWAKSHPFKDDKENLVKVSRNVIWLTSAFSIHERKLALCLTLCFRWYNFSRLLFFKRLLDLLNPIVWPWISLCYSDPVKSCSSWKQLPEKHPVLISGSQEPSHIPEFFRSLIKDLWLFFHFICLNSVFSLQFLLCFFSCCIKNPLIYRVLLSSSHLTFLISYKGKALRSRKVSSSLMHCLQLLIFYWELHKAL